MKNLIKELHILNGDYAFELWKQCHLQGESLVWRETYLDGPLPETDDLNLFRIARAEYLSTFPEVAEIGFERLYQYLLKMDETILNLPSKTDTILWFDSCMFDQTLLMRILSLFNRKKEMSGNVLLYCCEGSCLTADDFKSGDAKKVQLLPEDFELAGKAWDCFRSRDANGMFRLTEQGNFERMPQMKKALFRCIDEIPDQNGLTRTQRQILELVSDGCRSFMEIFKGLDSYEEYPFLGDTGCQRILDHLVEKGLLFRNEETYFLSRIETNH